MKETVDNTAIFAQNISYYDQIAGSYNEMLDKENSNVVIRQKVREKFASLVKAGWVLDFGGGIGLDLEWLTAKYSVFFCEPSDLMRVNALEWNNNNGRNIVFLEKGKSDFSGWHENLPFLQKVDGILANFGVINCIPDIESLFNSFALVTKKGAHLVVVFLERPLKKMWRWHRLNTIRTLLLGSPFIRYVYHNKHEQIVFVHSLKQIKNAGSKYFNYVSHERLGESGFMLMHLEKK